MGLELDMSKHEQHILTSHFFKDLFTTKLHFKSSFIACYNEIEKNKAMDVTPKIPPNQYLRNF